LKRTSNVDIATGKVREKSGEFDVVWKVVTLLVVT